MRVDCPGCSYVVCGGKLLITPMILLYLAFGRSSGDHAYACRLSVDADVDPAFSGGAISAPVGVVSISPADFRGR